jgi:hypothetical protein
MHTLHTHTHCTHSYNTPCTLHPLTPPPSVTSTASKAPKPLSEILSESAKKGLGGGLPGMAAMVLQVGSLMWLRTTINYQYRHGTSTSVALRTLYREGGVLR